MAAASDLPSVGSSATEQPLVDPVSNSNGTASHPADPSLQTSAGSDTFLAARQSRLANEQLPGVGRKTSAPIGVPGEGTAEVLTRVKICCQHLELGKNTARCNDAPQHVHCCVTNKPMQSHIQHQPRQSIAP